MSQSYLKSSTVCEPHPSAYDDNVANVLAGRHAYHEDWLSCASACSSAVALAPAAGALAAPEGGSIIAPQLAFKYCMPSGMGQLNWLSCGSHSFQGGLGPDDIFKTPSFSGTAHLQRPSRTWAHM